MFADDSFRIRRPVALTDDDVCVSLADVKEDERLPADIDDEDVVLMRRIKAAQNQVERMTGMILVPERNVILDFKSWPKCDAHGSFEIPAFPLRELISIKYRDDENELIELDLEAAGTQVDFAEYPGTLSFADTDFQLPELSRDYRYPIAIEVAAGNADYITDDYKLTVSLLACHWFLNREAGYGMPDMNHLPFWSMVNSLRLKAVV